MEQIVLDFYNKEVNSILDMRINVKHESGWNKDYLTKGQISAYVDTLTQDYKEGYKLYTVLVDFFFNHLDEFQNIMLGIPNKTYLDMEENKKEAIEYLNKLYGDK